MIELNKAKFEELANVHEPHCISIFIPTHRAGQEVKQGLDQRGFKNQIKEAKKQLQQYELTEREISSYVKQLDDLAEDQDFWRHQSDGLAVFLSKNIFEYFTLPATFEEFTFISNHFYLKPLLPVLDQDRKFYLLALSLHDVRMFEGYPYELNELEVEGLLPERLEDVVGYDYRQKHLEFREGHTSSNTSLGKTMFHGHGAGKDDKKDEMTKFFRAVNEGAMEILRDKKAPLILAAVEYLAPMYEEVNDYKYIYDKHISGNPEFADLMTLHEKAMNIIGPELNKTKKEKKEIFEQALSNKQASYDPGEIIPAAINGRVDTLFIKNRESLWGVYDQATNSIRTDDQQSLQNADLLNVAAIEAVKTGANVFLVDEEEMPEPNSKINAILRF